jgi:hypothetical protein
MGLLQMNATEWVRYSVVPVITWAWSPISAAAAPSTKRKITTGGRNFIHGT